MQIQNDINQNLNVASDQNTESTPKLDNSQLNPQLFSIQNGTNQVEAKEQVQQAQLNQNVNKIFQPIYKDKPDAINQQEALLKRLENLEAQNKELLSKLSQPKEQHTDSKEETKSGSTLNEVELANKLKAELLKEFEAKSAQTLEARFHEQRLNQIIDETNSGLLTNYKGVDADLVSAFYKQIETTYGKEFFKNIKVEAIKPTINLLFDNFYKSALKTKDGSNHSLPNGGEINQVINQRTNTASGLSDIEEKASDYILTRVLKQTGLPDEKVSEKIKLAKAKLKQWNYQNN